MLTRRPAGECDQNHTYGAVTVAVAVSVLGGYDATIWYVPVVAELSVQTCAGMELTYAHVIVVTCTPACCGVRVAVGVMSIVLPERESTALTVKLIVPPVPEKLPEVGLIFMLEID